MPNFLSFASKPSEILFGGGIVSGIGAGTTRFINFWDGEIVSATESVMQQTLGFQVTVTRLLIAVLINTVNVNSTYALRDDGSDVGVVTILASTIGEVDSGTISTVIVAESQVCYRITTSAGTGSLTTGTSLIEGTR